MTRDEAIKLYQAAIDAAQATFERRIAKIEQSEKLSGKLDDAAERSRKRGADALLMRRSGAKFTEIAEKLGVSVTRATQIVAKAKRLENYAAAAQRRNASCHSSA